MQRIIVSGCARSLRCHGEMCLLRSSAPSVSSSARTRGWELIGTPSLQRHRKRTGWGTGAIRVVVVVTHSGSGRQATNTWQHYRCQQSGTCKRRQWRNASSVLHEERTQPMTTAASTSREASEARGSAGVEEQQQLYNIVKRKWTAHVYEERSHRQTGIMERVGIYKEEEYTLHKGALRLIGGLVAANILVWWLWQNAIEEEVAVWEHIKEAERKQGKPADWDLDLRLHSLSNPLTPVYAWMEQNFVLSFDSLTQGRYHVLLTYAFSHKSFEHLFFNMLPVAMIGPPCVWLLGPYWFATMYFGGVVVCGMLSISNVAVRHWEGGLAQLLQDTLSGGRLVVERFRRRLRHCSSFILARHEEDPVEDLAADLAMSKATVATATAESDANANANANGNASHTARPFRQNNTTSSGSKTPVQGEGSLQGRCPTSGHVHTVLDSVDLSSSHMDEHAAVVVAMDQNSDASSGAYKHSNTPVATTAPSDHVTQTGKDAPVPVYVDAPVVKQSAQGGLIHEDWRARQSIGASGGVMAVVWTHALLFPYQLVYVGILRFGAPVPSAMVAGSYTVADMLAWNANDGVDHAAHIGGALFGLFFYAIIGRRARIAAMRPRLGSSTKTPSSSSSSSSSTWQTLQGLKNAWFGNKT